MTCRRILLVALCATAFAPSAAHAADVRLAARDVPLERAASGARALAPRGAPFAFDMVGLHWRGGGRVWFRTAPAGGSWSTWQLAGAEAEDQPDRGTAEAAASQGWNVGNPYWTGGGSRIQYRLEGRVTRLRAFFIASPAEGVSAATSRAARPAVIRRSQWGADESIVRAAPAYAGRLRLAVVHHTAGSNSYTRAESAAIVRGIQRYHVLSNGWNDIGYNFLVDKYGQVFEGRAGGLEKNVVGAHAEGFNTGSVGVAVLGTYGAAKISSAARSALVKLLAWRLDVAHVDPASALSFTSYGNDRFASGSTVRLRAVSGHRDTGYTSCPGTALYGRLDGIAQSVGATGLPKLYEPVVSGGVGGPVRFTARLSTSASWTVTVMDAAGAVVAEGGGQGVAVDWTWDSSAVPVARYTYAIAAGSSFRPATGVVPGPPPLAVRQRKAVPEVITPNGDGSSDRMRISFSLSMRSRILVTVLGSGSLVKTLVPDRELAAGRVSTTWSGTMDDGSAAPDGVYRIRIAATTDDQKVVRFLDVGVDRTLGSLAVAPAAFSPNDDGRKEQISFGYSLTRPADVRVHVLRRTKVLRRLFAGVVSAAGPQTVAWEGELRSGAPAPDGKYRVRVTATSSLGTRKLMRRFVVDTERPVVRILSARLVHGVTRVRLFLSEPARLRLWAGRRRWYDGDSITVERPAGEWRVWRAVRAGAIRIVPRDAAGNRGRPAAAQVL